MSGAGEKHHLWVRWGTVALAAVLLALLVVPPGSRAFLHAAYLALTASDPQVTRGWVAQFGVWGPLALIVAFTVQAVIPLLPALVLVAVTSLAYGPWLGFFIVYVGVLLGAAAGYWVGRSVGGAALHALVGRRARASAYVLARRYGLRGVVAVRLMPVLPSEAVNLVAGALRIPFWRFMLATSAGALPVTALVVWLAATPQRLTWGVAALTVLVGLVLLGRWLWSRRVRRPVGRGTA